MKCLACGAQMRLMDVRTDTTAPFGRRVFQCSSCRQIAQRLRLNRPRMAIAHLPALRPSEAQSERAKMIEEVNGGQSALKQQRAVDWGLAVESSSMALKQQAIAARASAWARTIEKLRERQMALKQEERQGQEVHHDE